MKEGEEKKGRRESWERALKEKAEGMSNIGRGRKGKRTEMGMEEGKKSERKR